MQTIHITQQDLDAAEDNRFRDNDSDPLTIALNRQLEGAWRVDETRAYSDDEWFTLPLEALLLQDRFLCERPVEPATFTVNLRPRRYLDAQCEGKSEFELSCQEHGEPSEY